MKRLIEKLCCLFGFHTLIESEEDMKLLHEAMQDNFAKALMLDRWPDGSPVVFKVCTRCGAKR